MTEIQNVRFEDWEAERLQDEEFRAAVEELEPAYQVARLRMLRGLTQAQLAKLVGTRQSSIARLESGKTQPSLAFLRRVIDALGGHLSIQIIAQEETLPDPEPVIVESKTYTSQFTISLPAYKHRELAEIAERQGTSLNSLAVTFLTEGTERQRMKDLVFQLGNRIDARPENFLPATSSTPLFFTGIRATLAATAQELDL